MNVKMIAALTAGLLSAAPAFSSPVTLDFESVSHASPIGSLYAASGAVFGLDLQGFLSSESPDVFTHAPSPLGIMSATASADAAVNAVGGMSFVDAVSFFYSAAEAVTVSVYSGLNGGGSLLGSIELGVNANDGCSDSLFCRWDPISLAFAGEARSIVFGGAVGAGFDNLSVNAVPLPAAAWLLLSGLGSFGAFLRRKRIG